jgi:hypothetical protein
MSNSFEGSGCTASHIYILAVIRSRILLRKHTVPYTRTGLPYPGKPLKILFIRSSMRRSASSPIDSKQSENRKTFLAHCFRYGNAVRSNHLLPKESRPRHPTRTPRSTRVAAGSFSRLFPPQALNSKLFNSCHLARYARTPGTTPSLSWRSLTRGSGQSL